MEATGTPVVFSDIVRAWQKISPFVHQTPVLTSSQADEKTGRKLFSFKCEKISKRLDLFKARGALNAVLQAQERSDNVVGFATHSSGNHGQALSWASKVAGFPCYVVVPETAPEVKKRAIKAYGGQLVECGPNLQDR
ncbi:hypothetical protein RRG08_006419 [Elysia crispata]|uniref:Tryptophan synthase beta chain-like PALP domain-containing protein n=1 Tax=Elysia crispata TaxID=231223 RepID=A0AAE1EBH3_9GAST|nr:hypothetical protein RRG08_006419 [Elysia crispata]